MNVWEVMEMVQGDFQARLQSLEYFRDIYVAAPRDWKDGESWRSAKSINERVDQALTGLLMTGGKIGAAVRVFQPTLVMKQTNGREGRLLLVCRCEVNPVLNTGCNGTNKGVAQIAYNVLRAGQGFTLLQGGCTLFAEGECLRPCAGKEHKFATAEVLLQSNFALSPLDAATMPRLVQGANGVVTLENITPGAMIFYSLEPEIFPAPNVAGAVPYSGPVSVDNGQGIRWAAYLEGLAGSNVGFATIHY